MSGQNVNFHLEKITYIMKGLTHPPVNLMEGENHSLKLAHSEESSLELTPPYTKCRTEHNILKAISESLI